MCVGGERMVYVLIKSRGGGETSFSHLSMGYTHSSVLAWRRPGTGEPGGLPSMGSHRAAHK